MFMLWTRVRGIATPSAIGRSVRHIDRRDGRDSSLAARRCPGSPGTTAIRLMTRHRTLCHGASRLRLQVAEHLNREVEVVQVVHVEELQVDAADADLLEPAEGGPGLRGNPGQAVLPDFRGIAADRGRPQVELCLVAADADRHPYRLDQ